MAFHPYTFVENNLKMLTENQIKKFIKINDKIRAEEIRARNYLIKLNTVLAQQLKEGLLDDFEVETQFSVFSNNKDFCERKGVEIGDSFFHTNIYTLSPDSEDFFNMNWYVSGMKGIEQLKDYHFGYLMHCLIDHSDLELEDLMAIDDVWIEIIVHHQFYTDKNSNSNYIDSRLVKLYVDDLRPTPEDYFRVYNVDEFIAYIMAYGVPGFISFDHDLGEGGTGYDCAKFLVEYCLDIGVSHINFTVHSQNPVGKENIEKLLNNFNREH